MSETNRTTAVSAPLDTQALPPLPRPRTVQPYTISELLGIYDANNGDWCAIAHAIETRYITELDAVYAHAAPYAERIRQLERELAERKPASIDTPEFRKLMAEHWKANGSVSAKRAFQAVIAYIDGRTAGTAPEIYTCIGKGGEYEHVGVAAGAGVTRGNLVHVYRDKTSGNLFYRTPIDFDTRMAPLAAAPSSMSKGKEEAK